MLEFQEGFFEQEIREGFYIDQTMKTVWAAELEVLQVIAEICVKYDLQWYAGFGMLLGAVRHEGFIPWDDDLDILMKREDYMKFLEVFPKEMPDGFDLFSCLTETGYGQYHSLVVNGDSISIEPDRLERFHGCPFTVAVDIFPLDYLPRDEELEKLQHQLFFIAGRAVQLVRVLSDPNAEKEGPDLEKTDKEFEEELMTAFQLIRDYCDVEFDQELIKKKDWAKLQSPLWELANHIAMLYHENESDYLVMYGDYMTMKHKKYPKEWFAEPYAATFENFMIPIPCGYDEFLKLTYGDYHIRYRGGGMHDYPYYNRQLKVVRKQVQKAMEQMERMGGIDQREDLMGDENAIPEEWQIILDQKKDGKKILLYGNEYEPFIEQGSKALDKLEKTLRILYEKRDQFILWWRAKPQMTEVLLQVDQALADRYQKIRNQYEQQNWGILDESTNADRAAELCDAYYGDMGYILQPLQREQKPILLVTYSKE